MPVGLGFSLNLSLPVQRLRSPESKSLRHRPIEAKEKLDFSIFDLELNITASLSADSAEQITSLI